MEVAWFQLSLVLIALADQGLLFTTGIGSFSICNASDGRLACATDAPNISIHLSSTRYGSVCPSVLCAWECKRDPRCLEFSVHPSSWMCDLFYTQLMDYQLAFDCIHFQVIVAQHYISNTFYSKIFKIRQCIHSRNKNKQKTTRN